MIHVPARAQARAAATAVHVGELVRQRKLFGGSGVIAAVSFEQITTSQVAEFIDFKVRDQGLKPKTANHYRSILRRVFNWASERQMVPSHALLHRTRLCASWTSTSFLM